MAISASLGFLIISNNNLRVDELAQMANNKPTQFKLFWSHLGQVDEQLLINFAWTIIMQTTKSTDYVLGVLS